MPSQLQFCGRNLSWESVLDGFLTTQHAYYLVLGLYCEEQGGWSLVCRVDVNPHPHHPQGHALPHMGSDIDQGLSADTTGAPAILLEDSCPQAVSYTHLTLPTKA